MSRSIANWLLLRFLFLRLKVRGAGQIFRKGLHHAQGYLRHELSQRIPLRSFPRLRFSWDPTFERAENIERLFKTLEEENAARAAEDATGANKATQLEDEVGGEGEGDGVE
jgi:hypothetical protein